MSTSSAWVKGNERDQRIVVYLSGGGYRAAIASIGALMAIIASDRWESVRKIVSVSGGGLPNAWLATRRPADATAALRSLNELYAHLTDRRRSVRQLLLTSAACVILVASLAWLNFLLWASAPELYGIVLALSLVLLTGTFAWLAPRIFLALDYRPYRGLFGTLQSAGWFREHVFVASDLWSARYVAFIAHADLSLVAAPPTNPLEASAMDFRVALRASTALPPALPAVRIGVPAPSADATKGAARREKRARRSMWLVDGGVTGNLGTQSDPGITGLSTRFDGLLAATRTMVDSMKRLTEDAERIVDLSSQHSSMVDDLQRSLNVQAVSLRLASNEVGRRALAAARSNPAKVDDADTPVDTDDYHLPPSARAAQDTIRKEAAAVQLALKSPGLESFLLSDDERKALEEPGVAPLAQSAPRGLRPDCGHVAGPWSACVECSTMNLVVDASGRPSHPSSVLRFLLWVPGLATLVNAIRTLQVLYQENLQEDRKTAQSFTVPIVQADDIYLREARVDRSRSELERGARWALADELLSGPLRVSMPEDAFVRAQLREDAARLKTALTAPSKKTIGFAHAALASGYIGTRDLFARDLSLNQLDAELATIDNESAEVIRAVVDAARRTHRDEKSKAQAKRWEWVLGLRSGFANFARASAKLS